VCGPDIKFAVCLSTRQSERLIGIVLHAKRLLHRKTRQIRSVVDYDAPMSSRQQTQPLDALWISPSRSAPLNKEPTAHEQPLPRRELQRGPAGPVGELTIGVGYRSGVVAADAVEEVIDGKWLRKPRAPFLKRLKVTIDRHCGWCCWRFVSVPGGL